MANATAARTVKGRLERTELGGICAAITEVIDRSECYINIDLDRERIKELHLDVDAYKVAAAMLAQPKLKLQATDIQIVSRASLKVLAGRCSRSHNALFELQRLRQVLKSVVVCGIKDVTRAIITLKDEGEKTAKEKADGHNCHKILVEGAGLQAVMGTKGVAGHRTKSTHIMEVDTRDPALPHSRTPHLSPEPSPLPITLILTLRWRGRLASRRRVRRSSRRLTT